MNFNSWNLYREIASSSSPPRYPEIVYYFINREKKEKSLNIPKG